MKNIMNKCILFVLILCCFTNPSFHCDAKASHPSFDVSTTLDVIQLGDSFYLLVDLSDNSGFGAVQFSITYDKNRLVLEDASLGEVIPKDAITSVNTGILGEIHFSAITVDNVTESGTLLVAKFKTENKGKAEFDFKLLAYADCNGMSLNSTSNDAVIVIKSEDDNDKPQNDESNLPDDDSESNTPNKKPGGISNSKPGGTSSNVPGGTSSNVPGGIVHEKPESSVKNDNEGKNTESEEIKTPEKKKDIQFNDVDETHWAYFQIKESAAIGLFSGTAVGTFSPDLPMTRAMFVTVLHRYAGSPDAEKATFTDLEDSWYTNAVSWAAENRIVLGNGDNTFLPHKYITRGEMAAILYRYKNSESIDMSALDSFKDGDKIPEWGKAPVAWAMQKGIIKGRPGGIMAFSDNATRAEAAVIFVRFLNI